MYTVFNKIIFLVCVLFTLSYASGPALDEYGMPTLETIEIKLTNKQIQSVSTQRIVNFSNLQMQKLSKYWTHKTIGIISENWKDCTCGMLYGVWTKKNILSIFKHIVPQKKRIGLEFEDNFSLPSFLKRSIIMDLKGNFYRNNQLLDIHTIKKAYKRNKKKVFINIPSKQVISEKLLNKYLGRLKKLNIEFGIFG